MRITELRRRLRPVARVGRAATRAAAQRRPDALPVERASDAVASTDAERYWSAHTVVQPPLFLRRRARKYFEQLAATYPLIEELMNYREPPSGAVLDYGCGTGDGIARFLLQGAEHVTGVDVSERALAITAGRLAMYGIPRERARLVQISDAPGRVPAPDGSFDYVHCHGVVQHVSDQQRVLVELARLLAPGGRVRIMVYNRASVWYHLYVPYVRQILGGIDVELPVDEAFRRSTDGEDCPISRAYEPDGFVQLAESAGLPVRFVGGYLSRWEIEALEHLDAALTDGRLADEHRAFLARLEFRDGLPYADGMAAGIGGGFVV